MVLKAVIVEQEAKDGNSIRLNDLYVEAVKKLPDGAEAPHWITQKTVSGNAGNKDYVYVGNACHEICTGKPNALLYRRKTYLKVLDESGTVQYVALYADRTPLLILLLLALVTLCCLALYKQPAEVEKPIATEGVDGQKDQKNERAEPDANAVGFITYTSPNVENCTWNANEEQQTFTIINPKGNTDDIAPHIYVDLNKDGDFPDDECVFNPITYDENGDVSSYGGFIAPGKQIDEITLTKKIPAGTYDAKIAYTAVDVTTKTLDNPMVFDFTLTVE